MVIGYFATCSLPCALRDHAALCEVTIQVEPLSYKPTRKQYSVNSLYIRSVTIHSTPPVKPPVQWTACTKRRSKTARRYSGLHRLHVQTTERLPAVSLTHVSLVYTGVNCHGATLRK